MAFAFITGMVVAPAVAAPAPALRERPTVKLKRPPPVERPRPPKKRRPPKPPLRPFVPVPVPERGQLSPEELTPLAAEYMQKIQRIVLQIRVMVSEAKHLADPTRLNCLLDKLFQAQNNKILADKALPPFELAVADKDRAKSFHHFNRVASAHLVALYFEQAAADCPFKTGQEKSTTTITRDQVPESPDPTVPATPLPERPPGATPII